MRILGFVNAFDELADPDRRLGRKVANFGSVAALLEHSSFDELHFFLPFQGAVGPFEQAYAPWLKDQAARVRLYPIQALPGALERLDYTALHAPELDRYFPELCHLRNRWARRPLPVTCLPHSLCYWGTQARNLYKVLPGPREFDSILCTSRAAREHLESAFAASAAVLKSLGLAQAGYAGRLDVVPLGVRAADFGGRERLQAQAALGLAPGIFTLLCLGRLTPGDKFDLAPLLGALSLLNRRLPARLVLAGAQSNNYAQALTALGNHLGLGERLRVFADFDSALKPDLLAAADVFVSPSDNLQETFGLALLEAMAAGLPVVASDFSGYRDLVEDGGTGYLIPTLGPADYTILDAAWPVAAEHVHALNVGQRTAVDLEIMVERLAALAQDTGLRERLGLAGRRRVEEVFDWGVVVRRQEALWDELKRQALAAPPAPPLPDVLGAGVGRVFGHFPSRAVSPRDLLAPGPLAEAFRQGQWARQPYPDAAQSLPPADLEPILEALERLDGLASLEQLQAGLRGRLPAYQVEHLALWGLKYGVLALRGA
jgi:glycosyltransferase involved in cell wall biosynthesis